MGGLDLSTRNFHTELDVTRFEMVCFSVRGLHITIR